MKRTHPKFLTITINLILLKRFNCFSTYLNPKHPSCITILFLKGLVRYSFKHLCKIKIF